MFYNKILEKIILPVGDILTGLSISHDLDYWRKVDGYSTEELATLQKEKLEKILLHAVSKTSYYQHIKLNGTDPFKWVQEFPILTKEILNASSEQLLSEKKKSLRKISSSGSSGISSSVYMNKKDISILRAGLIHFWEWSGYKMGNSLVQTGITPSRGFIKGIKDLFFRTTYISAFTHSQKQLSKLCKQLNNTRNFHLIGYASSLNVIAEHAIKHQYNIQLAGTVSLGDKLFNHYKTNIVKAFNCNVFDTYGSAEGFLIAAQADLDYLYILSPQTFIEILDDDNNPVPDGELGNVVVTRLDGYAMPLIRYKIGDLAALLPKNEYPTNRRFNYPLLKEIVGRNTDVIRTNDGKTLVVHSFTGVFEYVSEIKQFKIIQHSLDGILIEYIPSENFTKKILVNLTYELQKHIKNKDFIIEYKKVDFIESNKSGKPQIIESFLSDEK